MTINNVYNLSICILAGGQGKRMKSELPKVCVCFKGIPMIVHILIQALKLKSSKIIIITGKFNEIIQNTVKSWLSNTDFEKLRFVIQEEPLGTGHAVKCSLDCYCENENGFSNGFSNVFSNGFSNGFSNVFSNGFSNVFSNGFSNGFSNVFSNGFSNVFSNGFSNVLILNGDTPNLSFELLKNFIEYKSEVNKLLISEVVEPFGYGRIIMNNENEILKIVEEKDANEEEKKVNKINSGIYLINSENLKKYILLIKNNNKSNEYYLTDIIELMLNDDIKTYGYLIDKSMNNQILGVNNLEQLQELENLN